MKRAVIGGVMTAVVLVSGVAQAEIGLGLGVKAGTLGLGVEVTKSLIGTLNGRLGFNRYKFSTSGSVGDAGYEIAGHKIDLIDDADYNIDMKWQSTALLLDWHPGGGTFRLTAGYILNGGSLGMRVKPVDSYRIGGMTYQATDVSDIAATLNFSNGPYLGLGWGNAGRGGLGFSFELGVFLQDTPEVRFSGTCNSSVSSVCENFRASLAKEEQELRDSLDDIPWFYPQIALGISYGF